MGVSENKKGKDLEKIIYTNNLCILNNKSNIYLNPFTGSCSVIDLTLWNPMTSMNYEKSIMISVVLIISL